MKYLLPIFAFIVLISCSNSKDGGNNELPLEKTELMDAYFLDYRDGDSLKSTVLEQLDSASFCFSDSGILECIADSAHKFYVLGDKEEYLFNIEVREKLENDSLFANIQIFKNKPNERQRILNAGDFNISKMNSLDEFDSVDQTLVDLIVLLTFK
ncbi:MAG: hypothetical protein JXR53_03670 [Bacteroidales bacterium]|nr:hypothetical protein [Bacteroidales bacterium]